VNRIAFDDVERNR
jgi:hypothetical protein